uniref:Uncharacterized protein LOC104212639 n=1 Tax=Nicotiana sylvestris TaxID=4096 RepID=A0A1U7VD88_NICSY|nr:PREDICTED: uncharacterized protein LOC104212639 [Nicotiana sylvestris]
MTSPLAHRLLKANPLPLIPNNQQRPPATIFNLKREPFCTRNDYLYRLRPSFVSSSSLRFWPFGSVPLEGPCFDFAWVKIVVADFLVFLASPKVLQYKRKFSTNDKYNAANQRAKQALEELKWKN